MQHLIRVNVIRPDHCSPKSIFARQSSIIWPKGNSVGNCRHSIAMYAINLSPNGINSYRTGFNSYNSISIIVNKLITRLYNVMIGK